MGRRFHLRFSLNWEDRALCLSLKAGPIGGVLMRICPAGFSSTEGMKSMDKVDPIAKINPVV